VAGRRAVKRSGSNERSTRPRVSHEAAKMVNIQNRFCGGSSVLAVPFSIPEANKISLMNVTDRGRGSDK